MTLQELKRIADIIQSNVGYFNGWSVSEESERGACEDAAREIEKYVENKIKRKGKK